MNLYIRAIGFQYLDADFEEEMIHAGILDSIEKGFVIKNTKLNRGAVIVRVSESTGLYIYGRFKGDECMEDMKRMFLNMSIIFRLYWGKQAVTMMR